MTFPLLKSWWDKSSLELREFHFLDGGCQSNHITSSREKRVPFAKASIHNVKNLIHSFQNCVVVRGESRSIAHPRRKMFLKTWSPFTLARVLSFLRTPIAPCQISLILYLSFQANMQSQSFPPFWEWRQLGNSEALIHKYHSETVDMFIVGLLVV